MYAIAPHGGDLLEIRERHESDDRRRSGTISVRDHGVGLSTTDRERLFDAFYSTKPHGMGMGLAISRSIIEVHGGRLWADQGPGATFSFTVPARGDPDSCSPRVSQAP